MFEMISFMLSNISDFKAFIQETHCLFLWPATGDSLPVFWPATGDSLPVSPARYRRLLPVFFGPSSLTFSAKSPILGVKGGENKIITLCNDVQEGDIFHIRGGNFR